ncbi:hypothetical protein DRB87_00990 [Pandoraea sp. XY-2]|nr:hypothetical protein DRB87_00990 [Pandoraea sp. XY-2]
MSAAPDAAPASAAELSGRTTVARVAPVASNATASVSRSADGKASAAGAPKPAPAPHRQPAVSPTVADEARHRAAIRAQGGTP